VAHPTFMVIFPLHQNSIMQRFHYLCLLFASTGLFVSCFGQEEQKSRDEKLISTFQIVRFPNDPCVGSNSRNGTCYTSQECSDKSGTSSGSCADGFGVCCTFVISTCGSTTSENLTAWTQPSTVSSGECGLTVCPIDDSICSIRLDFTNFVITGPSTRSYGEFRRLMGHPNALLTDDMFAISGSSTTSGCLTDIFYMKGASPSTTPPSLCGTSTGQHMYLEADVDNCNYLSFNLADAATTATQVSINKGVTSLATRTWDMTITQIECTSKTLPPKGCTKYFWNAAGRAVLTNHGYQTTTTTGHLGQQHDRYCIRRERGYCVGCFATTASKFAVSGRSGNNGIAVHYTAPGGCCGYSSQQAYEDVTDAAKNVDGIAHAGAANDATSGLTQFGWDCIIIPGAFTNTVADSQVIAAQTAAGLQQQVTAAGTLLTAGQGPQICGNGAGIGAGVDKLASLASTMALGVLVSQGEATSTSVCTRQVPFMMEFMSDDLEGLGGDIGTANAGNSEQHQAARNTGFDITFAQLTC